MTEGPVYFQTKKTILIVLSSLMVAGYIIDVFAIDNNPISVYLNIAAIGIIAISIALTILSILNYDQTFSIIIYSLIANIFTTYYFDYLLIQHLEAEVFRSILIISMLVPIAGFVINKRHSLYIGVIMLVLYTVILSKSHNEFIINNVYMVFVITIGYTVGMYYLLYLLEISTSNQNDLIKELKAKNNELTRTNLLLTDQNIFIDNQNKEQKQLVDSRDKIYSVISHDIKNPLFAIISFCELTKEKIKIGDFSKVSEYNKMVQLSAHNLYNLIVNLLAWSRLHSGKMIARKEIIDPVVSINESVKILENLIHHKSIKLTISNQIHIDLNVDRNMFSTIIRNLISNAIKFTPANGNIGINTTTENNHYYITITDTGVGMSSEDINSILKSNINQPSLGTEGESGTGLGLEICKEFIKLHNGELLIESKMGGGSSFTVCLPLY